MTPEQRHRIAHKLYLAKRESWLGRNKANLILAMIVFLSVAFGISIGGVVTTEFNNSIQDALEVVE